jgi:hypothetical protein
LRNTAKRLEENLISKGLNVTLRNVSAIGLALMAKKPTFLINFLRPDPSKTVGCEGTTNFLACLRLNSFMRLMNQ